MNIEWEKDNLFMKLVSKFNKKKSWWRNTTQGSYDRDREGYRSLKKKCPAHNWIG